MKKLFLIQLIIAFIVAGNAVQAQYPSIPKDVQAASDTLINRAKRYSDIAFEKALPIINTRWSAFW